jgi:hypothetical protein
MLPLAVVISSLRTDQANSKILERSWRQGIIALERGELQNTGKNLRLLPAHSFIKSGP